MLRVRCSAFFVTHYTYAISLGTSEQNAVITALSFDNLPDEWGSLSIPITALLRETYKLASFILDENESWLRRTENTDFPYLFLHFDSSWNQWANPWSISDYARKLEDVVKSNRQEGVEFVSTRSPEFEQFGITCCVRSKDAVIADELYYWLQLADKIITETEDELAANAASNSFVTRFNFPPAVKTACEQYLLYFVQFLSDMGIETEANINHQAQDVLFSVTPKDKDQALSTIQDALTAYLCIPTSPTFASDAALSNDIAVRQLEANVYHLKGQLVLNQSILQAKDATIDALQLTNFQQRQMLEVAAYNAKPVKDENESVMDGIVQITKYEGKGYIVNFPKLIRLLKRSFDK